MRLIDWDKVLEWLHRQKETTEQWSMRIAIENYVDEMPTIDAEPVKHGQWVINRRGNIECSLCGNEPYHDNKKNMNYCPNCGAKMDEKEEETEVWNCSNGRKIIAPKGTFDKIYYGEIKDEYEDE